MDKNSAQQWTVSDQGDSTTPSWLSPAMVKQRPSVLRWLPNSNVAPMESAPMLIANSVVPVTGLSEGPVVPGPGRLPIIENMASERPPMFAEELAAVLATARETIEATRREALAQSEQEIVKLAMVIAERIVDRELLTSPDIVCGWVRQGVEALAAEDCVTAFVSPAVAGILEQCPPVRDEGFSVVVDERLPNSSCEVRGRFGRVNAGLLARLDAMHAALGLDGEIG